MVGAVLASSGQVSETGGADARLVDGWRARGREVPVRVATQTDAGTEAAVFVRELGPGARTRRALAALGICWAIAVVSILIPVAHFALVPGFALAGPIVAWLRYRQRSLVLGGVAVCPACGGRVRIKAQAQDWPLGAECDGCPEMLAAHKR